MKKSMQRGFTLIELLVVIAIIGILAAIILASLSTARSKGTDAKIKEQLAGMRAQAELYTGSGSAVTLVTPCPSSGTNLFADAASTNSLVALFSGITLANTACVSSTGMPTNGVPWAVSATLSAGNGYWCVDSTGVSRGATATGVAYTALSGASPAAITTTSCN